MHRWEIMVLGAIEIATGILRILSLGFFDPGWEMDWCAYCTIRDCRRRIRERGGI